MWDQAQLGSWAWGRSGAGSGSRSSACVSVLFTVGHAGDRRKGKMSSLGGREVALAQSVSQGSCASLEFCLAVPGGVCDCQAPCGLIPSSCCSCAQGWLGQRD